jgi:hypothetical protein
MASACKGDRDGMWIQGLDLLKHFQEAAWNHAEHLGVG